MNCKFGIAVVAMSLALCACGNQEQSKAGEKAAQPEAAAPQAVSKSLVVYYSQTGATKKLAEIFQKAKNADVFELAMVTGSDEKITISGGSYHAGTLFASGTSTSEIDITGGRFFIRGWRKHNQKKNILRYISFYWRI